MRFKIPMPKELIKYYQHAKVRVPIIKTLEVIAVYSFQCKSMRRISEANRLIHLRLIRICFYSRIAEVIRICLRTRRISLIRF